MPFQILRRPDVLVAHTKTVKLFFHETCILLGLTFWLVFATPLPSRGASFVIHLSKTFSSKHLIISFATCTEVFNSRFSVCHQAIMPRWRNEYVDIEDEKKKEKKRKNITLSSSSSSFPSPTLSISRGRINDGRTYSQLSYYDQLWENGHFKK